MKWRQEPLSTHVVEVIRHLKGEDALLWDFEVEQIKQEAKHQRRLHTAPSVSTSKSNSPPRDIDRLNTLQKFFVRRSSSKFGHESPGRKRAPSTSISPRRASRIYNDSSEDDGSDEPDFHFKRRAPVSQDLQTKLKELQKQAQTQSALKASALLLHSIKPDGRRSSSIAADEIKGELAREVMESRGVNFKRYRRLITLRDESHRRGDAVGYQRALKALSELDIYNPDFHNPEYTGTGHSPIPEFTTNLLVKDLHLYVLYCIANKISIILRDVAHGAASAYTGTFHLPPEYCDSEGYPIYEKIKDMTPEEIREITEHRVKVEGKGITVGLKSSPYDPIMGLIPLDPRLSKLMRFFNQNLKDLEEQLVKAAETGNGDFHQSLGGLVKLSNAEKEKAVILEKYASENQKAMDKSHNLFMKMVDEYNADMMYNFDKEKVALTWLDKFNGARFLGTTPFTTINGYLVHFMELGPDIARDSMGLPLFVAKVDHFKWQYYDQRSKTFLLADPNLVQDLINQGYVPKPVKVVVYRKFIVHQVTKRIVEDEANASIIVPDYDGLSHCFDRRYPTGIVSLMNTDEENIERLVHYYENQIEKQMDIKYVEGMGLVSKQDQEHVYEVRALTDWKQNHGDEFNNVLKTQELTPGSYVAIDSEGNLTILHNSQEIFEFYRKLWRSGRPMPLNPKWPVHIDSEGLIVYNQAYEVHDNKLGWAELQEKLDKSRSTWTIETLQMKYDELYPEDVVTIKNIDTTLLDSSVFQMYSRLKDDEKVVGKWVILRRLYLQPKLVLSPRTREGVPADEAQYLEKIISNVNTDLVRRRETKITFMLQQIMDQCSIFYKKHRVDCSIHGMAIQFGVDITPKEQPASARNIMTRASSTPLSPRSREAVAKAKLSSRVPLSPRIGLGPDQKLQIQLSLPGSARIGNRYRSQSSYPVMSARRGSVQISR